MKRRSPNTPLLVLPPGPADQDRVTLVMQIRVSDVQWIVSHVNLSSLSSAHERTVVIYICILIALSNWTNGLCYHRSGLARDSVVCWAVWHLAVGEVTKGKRPVDARWYDRCAFCVRTGLASLFFRSLSYVCRDLTCRRHFQVSRTLFSVY